MNAPCPNLLLEPADTLARFLRDSRGFAHKRDIDGVLPMLAGGAPSAVLVGDDCAAIPDGDGWLLFAIEGFLNEFVEREPWFAGYCGVMVNVSDIYAMGGRPTAVVDALWSRGGAAAAPVLEGLAAASRVYGVPIVGGHSNRRSDREQLSVAIVGRASKLLTSFDARPGDHLVAAIDLRGRFQEPYAYWNASTEAPPERLRADLEILPGLAEDGLCAAGKDISMAGVVGTALMLLECSGVGAEIEPARVPRPSGVPLERWLTAFPSYGFLFGVADAHLAAVQERFAARGIACAPFGRVTAGTRVTLHHEGASALLWDFAEQGFIGCAAPGA
ncbi:sll0787 family AIR synthase-like protein [Massilia sp. TN1-12]|uniref:sll0787 family AIR synthase-like protein n=1 Tax=Massilia paldalensis TaxID=3377675 RepID=UPI00384A760F